MPVEVFRFLKEGETTWNEEIGFVAAQTAGAAVDISVNSLQVSKVRVRIDRMTPGIDNVNVALAEFECYQYSDNTNDILEAQKVLYGRDLFGIKRVQ